MKRKFWAPALAIGVAILILAPTTFATFSVGETWYARLDQNRFPNGIAAVDAQLRRLGTTSFRLDIQILGGAGRSFSPRVYADGNCANPGGTGGVWVINREPGADPAFGPFLSQAGNSTRQIQVHPSDVIRIRQEQGELPAGGRTRTVPNEPLALMIAVSIGNVNYRTCTEFSETPPGPITFTTSTTGTGTTTTGTGTTTGTTTSSTTTGTTTSATSVSTTFTTTVPVTSFTTATSAVSTGTSVSTSFNVSTGTSTTVTIGTSVITSLTTFQTTSTISTTFSTGTTITL
jgi:hypothetical protein